MLEDALEMIKLVISRDLQVAADIFEHLDDQDEFFDSALAAELRALGFLRRVVRIDDLDLCFSQIVNLEMLFNLTRCCRE